jgi:hypothetical protein
VCTDAEPTMYDYANSNSTDDNFYGSRFSSAPALIGHGSGTG